MDEIIHIISCFFGAGLGAFLGAVLADVIADLIANKAEKIIGDDRP